MISSDYQNIQYKHVLQDKLSKIRYDYDIFRCTDMHYIKHLIDLSEFYHNIIHSCIDASDICIPKTGTVECHDKNILGWSDHVEELRRDSLMWNRHWRECGQPHNGPVSELHCISRACYHKAVRSVIKNSDRIRNEKMAEAIADNRTRDLFKEARKVKGNIMLSLDM